MFHVIGTMLQLLQMKGIFWGLPNEYPPNRCGFLWPFVFKNILEESIRLRLFPFSLTVETTRWLDKFTNGSIYSWEELISAFLERFFPP